MERENIAWGLVEDWKIILLGPIREAEELLKGETPVLCHIAELQRTTPTELATHFSLTTARIATILNNLERKGFIIRSHDTKDRRKVYINPTRSGLERARLKLKALETKAKAILDILTPEEGAEYVRLTRKLALAGCNRQAKGSEEKEAAE